MLCMSKISSSAFHHHLQPVQLKDVTNKTLHRCTSIYGADFLLTFYGNTQTTPNNFNLFDCAGLESQQLSHP